MLILIKVFPGFLLSRYGLVDDLLKFLDSSKLPFSKLIGDKGMISEAHESFLGLYLGPNVNPRVYEFVQKCQCAIMIGTT